MRNHAVTSVLVAVLASACGSKDSTPAATASTAELLGNWETGCVKNGTVGTSEIRALTFLASSAQSVAKTFSDAACATRETTIDIEVSYTVPGGADAPAGAKKIDEHINKAFFAFNTDSGVAGAIQGSFCGITSWVKDDAVDITGKTCGGEPFVADTYDVYLLDHGALEFGDTASDKSKDGSTQAKRPTTIDMAAVFTQK